jgi:hypothetical protein
MAKPAAKILWSLRLLALTGPLLVGCGAASPVDMYFGTDAGADFVPPPREAGSADAGVD